jgi:hypothetical protein
MQVNCCFKGRKFIRFRTPEPFVGPEKEGPTLDIVDPDDLEPYYENVNYCPFCGKKVPQEEGKE